MQKLKKYLLMFVIFGLAILAFSVTANNAQADNHYWKGGTGNLGTPTNYNPVVTNWATSDLYWCALSNANCAANLTTQVASMHILANYTGLITQGANDIKIGAGGFNQVSVNVQRFLGTQSYHVYCAGSFYCEANQSHTVLVMTGAGTITVTTYGVNQLRASANVTVADWDISNYASGFTIDSGRTLTIASGKKIQLAAYDGPSQYWNNSGTVNGAGSVLFLLNANTVPRAFNLGNLQASIIVDLYSLANGNKIFQPSSNYVLGPITVLSEASGYTMTVDLAGSTLSTVSSTISVGGVIRSSVPGAQLNAISGITVTANGQLKNDNITINCRGNFDTSLGTYTSGNGILNFYDSNYSIIQSAIQSITKLNINGTSSLVTWKINANHAVPLDITVLNPNGYYSVYVNNVFNVFKRADSTGKIYLDYSYSTLTYFKVSLNTILTLTSSPSTLMQLGNNYSYVPTNSYALTNYTLSSSDVHILLIGASLHGTPITLEVITLSIQIHSPDAQRAYQNYSLTIYGIYFTSIPITISNVTHLYNYLSHAISSNGSISYSFIFNTTELTGNKSTGLIIGRPMGVGAIAINITAIDSRGNKAYQTFVLNIVNGDSMQTILIIWLIINALLTILALYSRNWVFYFLAGMSWAIASLTQYFAIDQSIGLLTVGIGIVMLFLGLLTLRNKS
jgi:hypothetical protein